MQNLRVALSLSPDHASFQSRLQSNPALLARCSVQWIDAWSDESSTAIAQHLFTTMIGHPASADDDHPDVAGPLQVCNVVTNAANCNESSLL